MFAFRLLRITDVPILGRSASGVKIVNIAANDSIVGVARVAKET